MAATKQKLFITCPYCGGTKQELSTVTNELVDCTYCKGKGHLYWGYIRIPETPETE